MNIKAWSSEGNYCVSLTESNMYVLDSDEKIQYSRTDIQASAWWNDDLYILLNDSRHTPYRVSYDQSTNAWTEKRLGGSAFMANKYAGVRIFGTGLERLVIVLELERALEKPLAVRQCTGEASNSEWSHRGNCLAVSDGIGLWGWRPGQSEFENIVIWPADAPAMLEVGLKWSPDDRRLIRYGALAASRLVLENKLAEVFNKDAAGLADDGIVVLQVAQSKWHLEIIDLDNRSITRSPAEFKRVMGVSWSDDGKSIYVSEESQINFYKTVTLDAASGKRL